MAPRRFKRRLAERSYRKVFFVATEGRKTEPAYFQALRWNEEIQVKVIPAREDSAPKAVLKRASKHVQDERLRKGDEVWLVIDRDRWEQDEMTDVCSECRSAGYHLAVSNPMFEYWLLLHFEAGSGIKNSAECTRRLKKYLPNYAKNNLDATKLQAGVRGAVDRAKAKDSPPCRDWPSRNGSTVYRLIEKLLPIE